MELQQQLIFFFSALGAANGIALSVYFTFFRKPQQLWHRLLGGLLFVLSFRILKSAFFYFNPHLFEQFVQAGLVACALIGPFLFSYCRSVSIPRSKPHEWMLHVLPFLFFMIVVSTTYPYYENRSWWGRYIIRPIYWQWFLYMVWSIWISRSIWQKAIQNRTSLAESEILLLNVSGGVSLIWLAYYTSSYTSYIVGALTFSFLLYISVLLWALKRKEAVVEQVRYANKTLDDNLLQQIEEGIRTTFLSRELFKNPDLKLADLAKALGVSAHQLSQYLNEQRDKSFNQFINEFRVDAAKKELLKNDFFTAEAVGYDCGFNSKSTFYSTFKKLVGCTPAAYRQGQE